MPSEQFSQAVRGSNATPVSVSNRGSLDTNDYPEGGGFKSSSYPITVNPSEVVKEIVLTVVDTSVDIEITTTSGTTFTLPVEAPASFEKWDIDEIRFLNPDDASQTVAGAWAGE